MSNAKQLYALSSKCIQILNRNFFYPKWLILILSISVISEALATWQLHKQTPQLTDMLNQDCSFIASLTNITSIRKLLKPILTERIVATKSHDDVAWVYLLEN